MTSRLENVLARQKKHFVRDALAVFVLVVAIGVAGLLLAFQAPSAPADPPADDSARLVHNNMTPAQITAQHLAQRPDSIN